LGYGISSESSAFGAGFPFFLGRNFVISPFFFLAGRSERSSAFFAASGVDGRSADASMAY